VENKPKLTGISFNIFALVGLLVILPIGTAFVTNLSNANNEPYQSISTKIYNDNLWQNDSRCQDNTYSFTDDASLIWLNKGLNRTQDYENRDGTNNPNLYDSIWDTYDFDYLKFQDYCLTDTFYRDNTIFTSGSDIHRDLYNNYLTGSSPNYAGFIGYTGDQYQFRINQNMMQYISQDKDISGFNFEFIDYQTGYNRDNSIFQELNIYHDIEIIRIVGNETISLKYYNFESDQTNKKCYQSGNWGGVGGTANLFNGTLPEICHLGINLKFDFTPFETIEINEVLQRDYNNIYAIVTITNIDFETNITGSNLFQNNIFVSQNPIPFAGDANNGFNFEVRYSDTIRTNFYLSGGTFILGGALWLLAISSTPYWNPVINTLGGKK